MKTYFVYVTNCSNHNSIYRHDNLADAVRTCQSVSKHNTAVLIEGKQLDWKKLEKKFPRPNWLVDL